MFEFIYFFIMIENLFPKEQASSQYILSSNEDIQNAIASINNHKYPENILFYYHTDEIFQQNFLYRYDNYSEESLNYISFQKIGNKNYYQFSITDVSLSKPDIKYTYYQNKLYVIGNSHTTIDYYDIILTNSSITQNYISNSIPYICDIYEIDIDDSENIEIIAYDRESKIINIY